MFVAFLAVTFSTTTANAWKLCKRNEHNVKVCLTDVQILNIAESSGDDEVIAGVEDFIETVDEVVRVNNSSVAKSARGAETEVHVDDAVFKINGEEVINPAKSSLLNQKFRFLSQKGGDVHEYGDNTDGQVLYGPPSESGGFACHGYESIDTCKACCMASRASAIPLIYAIGVKCHTAAGPCIWCHVGCAALELGLLAALAWNTRSCNNHCEDPWWNDRSITVPSSITQGLESSEDYTECSGWSTWEDGERVLMSTPWSDGELNCVIDIYEEAGPDFWYDMNSVYVTAVGMKGPDGMIVHDYRIQDVSILGKGRQIPYVGWTQTDEHGLYMNLIAGGKIYLDVDWSFDAKLWVWGDIVKDDVVGEILDPHDVGIIQF